MATSSPFRTALLTVFACLTAGAFIGSSTNAINGWISPLYFRNIMGWDFENIWNACVAQGIFEGLLYGMLFAIVFVITFITITKASAPFTYIIKQLLKLMGIIYMCWVIGGILAVALAAISPEFYRSTFQLVPNQFDAMLGYAWVGGSIWGAIFGSLVGVVLGIIGLRGYAKKAQAF